MTSSATHDTGPMHYSGPPDDEATAYPPGAVAPHHQLTLDGIIAEHAVPSSDDVGESGTNDTEGVMVPLSDITEFLRLEDTLLRARTGRLRNTDPGLLGDSAEVVERGVELAHLEGQRAILRRQALRLAARTGIEVLRVPEEEDAES